MNKNNIIKQKTCDGCKENFNPSSSHRLCPICRYNKYKKHCSCGKIISGKSTSCIRCHNIKNNKKITFKDGQLASYTKKGYVLVKMSDHPRASNGFIFEHILVMEKFLGRYLEKGENVHHKNGIKDDNSIKNLELWIRPQPTGIRVRDAIKWAKQILRKYK